jgi:hypothetical protein
MTHDRLITLPRLGRLDEGQHQPYQRQISPSFRCLPPLSTTFHSPSRSPDRSERTKKDDSFVTLPAAPSAMELSMGKGQRLSLPLPTVMYTQERARPWSSVQASTDVKLHSSPLSRPGFLVSSFTSEWRTTGCGRRWDRRRRRLCA